MVQGKQTTLSSQVHLQAQPWLGGGRGSGDREALPLKRVTRPEPTTWEQGCLATGAQLWVGHQGGHSWQVAVGWLISCGVSAPLVGGGGVNLHVSHMLNTVMTDTPAKIPNIRKGWKLLPR